MKTKSRLSMRSGANCRSSLVLLIGVAVAAYAAAPFAQERRELVFLTWSEYIDPELVEKFEQAHEARVRFVYYDSDDGRDAMLADADGKGFDIAIVSGVSISTYAKRQWIAPISTSQVPNRRHIDERWNQAYPESEQYGIPYMWGSFGIAYREDLVPSQMKSWKDLLAPPESMKQRIAMTRDGRDLVGLALLSLGYSGNSSNRDELKAAEKALLAQKPYVRTYDYISLDEQSALASGEIWAAFAYNGDALLVMEQEPKIRFVSPPGQSLLWIDYLTVMQVSANKDLAHAFIDFLNEPQAAAQLAEYLWSATPNAAALPLTSDEYRQNTTIFPGEDAMRNAEFAQPLPPRAQKAVNAIRARVLR